MYTIRFDMRAPESGAPSSQLYRSALEMAAWAESRGCIAAVVCEHHGAEDGYLPSPLILASALAARTTSLPIMIAVALLPFYDPVRLAEDLVVLDVISEGRVTCIAALGYRPEEFAMYGVDIRRRGQIADEKLGVLLQAKRGDPFVHDGRRIHVTPAPLTAGGPTVMWGGGSAPAARRAGRFGIGFLAQGGGPELQGEYEEASRAAGHEPGFCFVPPTDTPAVVFVADDPDRAWDELGPYLMHDVRAYASWNEGNQSSAGLSRAQSAAELRAERRSHLIVGVEEAVDLVRAGTPLTLHPLIGGLPPDIAWPYLQIVGDKVMPALAG